MPGLERAAAWEFLIRVFKRLFLLQPRLEAGTIQADMRFSLSGQKAGRDSGREERQLKFLVHAIHLPLRRLDYDFSGTPRQWLDARFRELDLLAAHSPGLMPFLDPWEYLSESNTPYHLLYRLSESLANQGLIPEARAAIKAAIQLKPFEPKLWSKRLSLAFKSPAKSPSTQGRS